MAQLDWQIRKAEPVDATGLQNCVQAAYAIYNDRMEGRTLPPMDLDYAREIRDYPTWVAEHNGNIVGGLTLQFDTKHTSIANIAVHPEFQGHGIGSGLMSFAERKAEQLNHAELHLATHVLLTENISLYRHLGWTETDRDAVRVYMNKMIKK